MPLEKVMLGLATVKVLTWSGQREYARNCPNFKQLFSLKHVYILVCAKGIR
jgi:hypothetical protein